MQPIHISLDVWQTLIKSNPAFISERNKIVSEASGLPEDEAIKLLKINKTKVDRDQEQYEICAHSSRLWEGFAWRLLGESNWSFSKSFDIRQKYNDAWLANPPIHNHEDVKALHKLKSLGHTLSITSNTGMLSGDILGPWLRIVYGDIFCEMNFSDVTGIAKPNPKAFGESVKWAKIFGRKVVHLGDSEADRKAAEAAGVESVVHKFKEDESLSDYLMLVASEDFWK